MHACFYQVLAIRVMVIAIAISYRCAIQRNWSYQRDSNSFSSGDEAADNATTMTAHSNTYSNSFVAEAVAFWVAVLHVEELVLVVLVVLVVVSRIHRRSGLFVQ